MLLIVYSGETPQQVTDVLEQVGVQGWTELTGAHGVGATGRREGTRAWPGASAVFFTVLDTAQAETALAKLEASRATLPPGERLHAALMPVGRFF
jgi:hypothetical protein